MINIFLLLDISASMTGAPLEALKQGVGMLYRALGSASPRRVRVSVITYESVARQIIPLTDVSAHESINLPPLEPGGTSGLGGALRLLVSIMPDYRPTLVYIFTDGDPTDDWEPALEAVHERVDCLIGLACGLNVNEDTLRSITERAFLMDDLTPDVLAATFRSFT